MPYSQATAQRFLETQEDRLRVVVDEAGNAFGLEVFAPATDVAELIPYIGELVTLHKLRIDVSDFMDDDLAQLSALTELRELYISKTLVTERGLSHLRQFAKLNVLALNRQHCITDTCVANIAALRNLQTLHMAGTQITDAGIEPLAKLSRLQKLYVDESPAITGTGFRRLIGLLNLDDLVAGPNITDDGLAAISVLSKLDNACLLGEISDQGIEHVVRLKNLKSLSMNSKSVSSKGWQTLKYNENLQYLSLDDTNLDDDGLASFVALNKLATLWVMNTKISFAGYRKFHAARPDCTIVCKFTPEEDLD